MHRALTYDDVMAAAQRLEPHAHRTPTVRSRLINEQLGSDIMLKAENFQRAGAFKFRGAFNALSQFSRHQRRAGVVAYSSGNHAQAIALSAQILDIPATIVMPTDAPRAKIDATVDYGAHVVRYNRYTEDREQIGRHLADASGMTLIPPYDHPDVIAGQGTAAKEMFHDVGDLDLLVIPLGGGGLLAGSCLSSRALSPHCEIYGVEPETGNDGQQSLRSGKIVHIDTPTTIADGAQTQHLGDWTFEIITREVKDIVTVPDSQLVHSMQTLATFMKIIVEPTGCLGFAALRELPIRGKRVGVIISGGNVELAQYSSLLASAS